MDQLKKGKHPLGVLESPEPTEIPALTASDSRQISLAMNCFTSVRLRRDMAGLHRENASEAARQCQGQLRIIDASVSMLFQLLMVLERETTEQAMVWPGIKDRSPDPDALFQCTLGGFIDCIVGTRQLAVAGLDSPARTILRSGHELSDFLMCFLGNEIFFSSYCACAKSDDPYADWKRLFKRSMLANGASKVLLDIGLPPELNRNHRKQVDAEYALLSRATHVDYSGLFCGNRRRTYSHPAVMQSATLGLVGPATSGTLHMLAGLSWITLKCIQPLLVRRHRWPINSANSNRRWCRRVEKLDQSMIEIDAARDR